MTEWLVRRPAVTVARGDSYLLVDHERGNSVLAGVDVEALATVLALAALPVTHEQLCDATDEGTVAKLIELGLIAPCDPPEPVRPVEKRRCRRLVIGLSGAVGVTNMLQPVIALADTFAEEVEVVITRNARRFLRPRIFEYRGLRVWSDPYRPKYGAAVPHHHLATTADLVLIAPASASTLARLASGACDDLLSLVVAATKAPVVLAPSMNPQMWIHPPIARNVAQLRADGFWVIDPGVGSPVADRASFGVGPFQIDLVGLTRALDGVLTQHGR